MKIPWTRAERRWRHALCSSMLPAHPEQPLPGFDAVDTDAFWREYERAAPELLRFGFRAAVWALTFSPPLLLGKARTFAGLEPEERDRLLERISASRFYMLRQLPMTVKLVSCFAYLRDDDVRKRVERAFTAMNVVDGKKLTSGHTAEADVVVVGTGPAGAAAGREAARAGARVISLDEGPYLRPSQYPEDGFSAMALMYRGLGATVSRGAPIMPLVQGRVVGGTSVVNGAISWRMPRDVHEEWLAADPGLGDALAWETVEGLTDQVEADLEIHPTEPEIAGPNNLLLKKGADALGIENRPIWRNVRGCKGLGQCLQGCPQGNKLSMDLTYLEDACACDARVYSSVRVDRVTTKRGRATGVRGVAAGGGIVKIRARHAVVLAASAVQTPALLLRSRIKHGPVGKNFQAHPGASVTGRFPEEVRLWTGATQGHEVTGLRKEGLKFEALGYDMALVALRLKGTGQNLAEDIADMAHQVHWGAAIRATSRGRVGVLGRHPQVAFSLGAEDMRKVRRGVRMLGEIMLAAGADYVEPGVFGWHRQVRDRKLMASIESEGPLDPKAYTMAVTHMFGTCRMGTDPDRSVVGPNFRHHHVESLFVADSSVFPSNIGVNPQTTIIALATLCGQRIAEAVR